MKIAQLSSSLSRAAGGIFEAERMLAQALQRLDDVELHAVGLHDEYTEADAQAWGGAHRHVVDVAGPASFGFAPRLFPTLMELSPDVLHTHGIWMYPSWAALRWAKKSNKPHIISPHGMLDAWAMNNARWKKRMVSWLFEHDHLRNAACIHALNHKEYHAIRDFGLSNAVAIIPNGVELPTLKVSDTPPWVESVSTEDPVLLFLGRIHPKKGLSELLEAWHELGDARRQWHLAIIGWDDGGHEEALHRKALQLGVLNDTVHFLGPRFGSEKAAAFSHADAFILPSYSEGLPMVVLEAWSYELPVVLTPESNIPEGFDAGAALQIRPKPDSIVKGLNRLFTMSATDRKQMGQQGRALVEKRFTWGTIAEQMMRVYQWVLRRGLQPSCVRL